MALVTVDVEPAESTDAVRCLGRYYAELGERFDAGFNPDAVKNFDPAEMEPPHGWFVIARLDGKPVGCGALKRLEDGVGEIKRVWTDASVRGQGVAGKVMDRLEALARDNRLPVVRLDTNRTLTEAQAFYLKRGYREIACYNDNPYADHWFEKRLEA